MAEPEPGDEVPIEAEEESSEEGGNEGPYSSIYAVWLCPAQDCVPGLEATLTSEMEQAAGRLRATNFPPHITIAAELEGEEEAMKGAFFEMAQSLKVRGGC
jgi:hypothetical protein